MLNKIIDFSIFSVIFFNSIVLFKTPFEFQITYIPLIILLFIFIFKYRFPTKTLYLFLPLLIFGLINIFFNNNTVGDFFKIYINVFIGVLFFYYVFEYYDRDVEHFFSIYAKWAYVSAIICIVQLVSYWIGFKYGYNYHYLGFNKWGIIPGGLGLRVNGIFSEPSYVGSALAPAFFVSVFNLIFKQEKYITKNMGIVIIIAYLLSFSTVAYLGIFITLFFLLLNFGLVRYFFIVIPISLGMFILLYTNVNEFKVRMDGLKALYWDDIIEKEGIDASKSGVRNQQAQKNYLLTLVHGSSFVQYNNYYIAKSNFLENPFFGTGLGSHGLAFKKYDQSSKLGNLYNNNQADANSMLLRTISEAGLFGIIFLFLFIKNNYVSRGNSPPELDYHWILSNAILVLILLQLARQGNYTFGGFMAYMWLYYYIKQDALIKEDELEEIEKNKILQSQLPIQQEINTH